MGRQKKEYGVGEILAALEAVVAQAGADYIYDKAEYKGLSDGICRYMHGEDAPGCLIGRVLIKLGAQPAVIFHAEDRFIEANGHGLGMEEFLSLLAPTWGTLGYSITDDAVSVLTVAQNCQDVGNTWGRALDEARNAVDVDA